MMIAPGGISIIPITQSIVEGEIARFQITADHPTNFERAINIAITESGNYLSNQFKLPDFATIEAGQRTTIVEVETEADDIIESDGEISVRVLAGDNYVRANLHTNAAIQVRNEDQVTLSISALSTTVTEGLPVNLTILSTPVIPNQDLELNFVHDVAGEFLLVPPIQQIILTPSDFVGQEAQVVIAQTINDTTFEAIGLISSELVASSDYHVADAPNNFTQINLVDNDEPRGISIVPVTTNVNEGNDLVFQITAASVESEARSINLAVSEQASNYVSELVNQIVPTSRCKKCFIVFDNSR